MWTILGWMIIAVMFFVLIDLYQKTKIRGELKKQGKRNITNQNIKDEQKRREIEALQITAERRRLYEEQEENQKKEKNKIMYQENMKKGSDYEEFIANHFRSRGYDVIEHGKLKGKKDLGIDLIATKDGELNLIQCKNWSEKNKVKHNDLKEFLGNVTAFIEKNPELQYNRLKRLYIISNESLHNSAKHYLRENEIIECLHLPMR